MRTKSNNLDYQESLDGLYKEIHKNLKSRSLDIEKVTRLETSTPETKRRQLRDDGWNGVAATRSYSTLLKVYLFLEKDDLDMASCEHIKEKIAIIDAFHEQAKILESRTLNTYYRNDFKVYDTKDKDSYRYSEKIISFVDQVYSELDKKGIVYTVGGTSDHFEVYKYETYSDGREARQTVYNSGFESEEIGGKVKGKLIKDIKNSNGSGKDSAIKGLMRVEAERFLRPSGVGDSKEKKRQSLTYNILKEEKDSYLGTERGFLPTDPQRKVNCTTRSLREFFNDGASEELSRSVRKFMINPENTLERITSEVNKKYSSSIIKPFPGVQKDAANSSASRDMAVIQQGILSIIDQDDLKNKNLSRRTFVQRIRGGIERF